MNLSLFLVIITATSSLLAELHSHIKASAIIQSLCDGYYKLARVFVELKVACTWDIQVRASCDFVQ